jgi:dihydrofolate reductase
VAGTVDRSIALVHVQKLKQQPGKGIWLCGGGELAATLFAEIDEVILQAQSIKWSRGLGHSTDRQIVSAAFSMASRSAA